MLISVIEKKWISIFRTYFPSIKTLTLGSTDIFPHTVVLWTAKEQSYNFVFLLFYLHTYIHFGPFLNLLV